MGIFTKKSAKRKSDDTDETSDAWLMGEDDLGNVSLDYLEAGTSDPPSADELASAPPPPTPEVEDAPRDEPDLQGWHLPEFEQSDPTENRHDRRTEDEPVAAIAPSMTPAPISESEARADFLAVDIPDVTVVPTETPDVATLPVNPPASAELASPENSTVEAIEPVQLEPTDLGAPTIELPTTTSSSASNGPKGPQADTLLEILGLLPGSDWAEIRDAHQALMRDHDESADTDPSRVALGRAIRREMNTAYAALRLMAVD